MNDYIIVTDSTADLPADIIKEADLRVMPLKFRMDDKDYNDGDMPAEDFFTSLQDGAVSTTSQPTPFEFIEMFEPYVAEGKGILYIAFSSGLSGTYNSACTAAKDLEEKYPDAKIKVIDSLCASAGEGLLVYLTVQKKQSGMDLDELAQWVENKKLKICHWFTVEDLFFLKRGGRISAMTALLGTTLAIKPVMHVDNNGKLIPVKKVRGRRQSIEALVKEMKATAVNPSEQTVFITHGNCKDEAEYTANLIKQELHVKNVIINMLGTVIGSHSGPGTLAIFFVGTER